MKTLAAVKAKLSRLIASSMLVAALAACGSGYGGSNHGSSNAAPRELPRNAPTTEQSATALDEGFGDGAARKRDVVVHLAPSKGGAESLDATGIVANATQDFVVSDGTRSAPAAFIFCGDGIIAGWSPTTAGGTDAITAYTATDGAVYKGLALANNGRGYFLYAADFVNGKVDVLDAAFAKQTPTDTNFAFKDSRLPAGYSPFGIQAIETAGVTRIYVAYAKHDAAEPGETPGDGLGLVNAFDTNGVLVDHLVPEGGKLNAPWGLALAPADFGALSNALLVGNFGDGKIHGYDPSTGRYLGELADGDATTFVAAGTLGRRVRSLQSAAHDTLLRDQR